MNLNLNMDFEKLLDAMTQHSALGPGSIHGPDHWARVERNGMHLAMNNGADQTVVRLFAIFHDAERQNEGYDPQHGQRAAELVASLHGDLFTIDEHALELLCVACELHHEGGITDDVTIGTCWDADRLDLTRVNMTPRLELMSTEAGKTLVRSGHD